MVGQAYLEDLRSAFDGTLQGLEQYGDMSDVQELAGLLMVFTQRLLRKVTDSQISQEGQRN